MFEDNSDAGTCISLVDATITVDASTTATDTFPALSPSSTAT
jgi:hypothetical protein